ncbi:MAG: HIT domain-containing protein [Rhodospirillales bacterium]|nr:HIT domain-containing protein [Rhodospirillales bacterium]
MTIDFTTYDDDNIFARILRGELPNTTVHEDDHVLAFHDIAPQAPVHVLVIPKGRYIAHDDFHREASDAEIVAFWRAVATICGDLDVAGGGHRLIANRGADSGQLVPHFHVHILAGRNLGPLIAG